MHRILLREIVIDAPTETFAAVRDFWAAALLTAARQVERYPEFTALEDPAALSVVGLRTSARTRRASTSTSRPTTYRPR